VRAGLAQCEAMLLAGGGEALITLPGVAGHIGGHDDLLRVVRPGQADHVGDRIAVAYQEIAAPLAQPGPQVGEAVEQERDAPRRPQ
jgi:hypothetical protein